MLGVITIRLLRGSTFAVLKLVIISMTLALALGKSALLGVSTRSRLGVGLQD